MTATAIRAGRIGTRLKDWAIEAVHARHQHRQRSSEGPPRVGRAGEGDVHGRHVHVRHHRGRIVLGAGQAAGPGSAGTDAAHRCAALDQCHGAPLCRCMSQPGAPGQDAGSAGLADLRARFGRWLDAGQPRQGFRAGGWAGGAGLEPMSRRSTLDFAVPPCAAGYFLVCFNKFMRRNQ